MIRKLRKKFILINMSLIGAVLLVVCGAFCVSSYQRLESESVMALKQAVSRRHGEQPPKLEVGGQKPEKPFSSVPVFVVNVDETGNVTAVQGYNVTITAETVGRIVATALAAEQRLGVLDEYHLRYLVEQTPDGTRIAFADRGSELGSIAEVLITSLAAFVVALGALFGASVFLARWALRPVERAWLQQQQFVADASHELKTPLTVILANTGILLTHREELAVTQIKWVENTQAEAMRMKKLVDELLFLAKSDAARVPLTQFSVNLSDVVWSGVLPFESLAFERGVVLDSEIAPAVWVMGDEGQLRQLVAILLDNACKYADTGGAVTVRLTARQERICLWVHNTGAEIPEEDRIHLFERFYRADKARVRGQGGYGLGLAIAKSLAELHGGRITVENGSGGVAFAVTLPRAATPEGQPPP